MSRFTPRQKILSEYQHHPFLNFHLHNDLVGVTADREDLVSEDEIELCDFEEVIFAVEINWLLDYKNKTSPDYWDKNRLHRWLKSIYTGEDGAAIFRAALAESAIAILEFN